MNTERLRSWYLDTWTCLICFRCWTKILQPYLSRWYLNDEQGGHCPGNQGNQGKVGESEKGLKWSGKVMRKIRAKSGNLNRLSERKSSTIPQAQSDDLSFYQNSISRNQGKFSLRSGKRQGKWKWKKWPPWSWRSVYCDLNKGECDLNQSKDDSFVKRVAMNNNWNIGDRHKIHEIFLIVLFSL